jgi:hypothetical protein
MGSDSVTPAPGAAAASELIPPHPSLGRLRPLRWTQTPRTSRDADSLPEVCHNSRRSIWPAQRALCTGYESAAGGGPPRRSSPLCGRAPQIAGKVGRWSAESTWAPWSDQYDPPPVRSKGEPASATATSLAHAARPRRRNLAADGGRRWGHHRERARAQQGAVDGAPTARVLLDCGTVLSGPPNYLYMPTKNGTGVVTCQQSWGRRRRLVVRLLLAGAIVLLCALMVAASGRRRTRRLATAGQSAD